MKPALRGPQMPEKFVKLLDFQSTIHELRLFAGGLVSILYANFVGRIAAEFFRRLYLRARYIGHEPVACEWAAGF